MAPKYAVSAALAACVLLLSMFVSADVSTTPAQVRVALGGSPDSLAFVWQTPTLTDTRVRLGTSSGVYTLSAQSNAAAQQYTYNGYTSGFFHRVKAQTLKPGTVYYYQVGDGTTWSSEFQVRTAPASNVPVTFGVVGDVGDSVYSHQTMQTLLADDIDVMLHDGDITYANGNETIWDDWGVNFEYITATLPYMVCPGNHEIQNDYFPAFNLRFRMPSQESGAPADNVLYWSTDYSYVHLISLSTETEYNTTSAQFAWLKADLAAVNRTRTPWIVLMWHRPVYNTNLAHQQEAATFLSDYEDLLYQYAVDFAISGHVHAYERIARIYKYELNNDAPQYFTVGDGGTPEGLATTWLPQPRWSMFRESSWGHSKFQVFNETHIQWTWIRNALPDNSTGPTIGDQTWIIRDYPRPQL